MDAEACGMASLSLGAGRVRKEDAIDYSAGIILRKKTGDKVITGDTLAYLHTSSDDKLRDAMEIMNTAITIESEPAPDVKTVLAVVSENGVELL